MINPYLWIPGTVVEEDGQWGFWSRSADQRHAQADPEVYSDPTYTPIQILREKSVLLRSGQANRQPPAHVFDFTEFDRIWGD